MTAGTGFRADGVNETGQVGGGGGIRTPGAGYPAQQLSRLPLSSAQSLLPRLSFVSKFNVS